MSAGALAGRTCLLTGANAGIGRATALGLARAGAELLMVCRDPGRGEEAREFVARESGNPQVQLLLCDLSSQSSVRELAQAVLAEHEALHVLINNAAILPRQRELAEGGLEMQFATNHLGPFLLTSLLLQRLRDSAPARVINVSSLAHYRARLDLDRLQADEPYRRVRIYSRTKLMNVLFTLELARRLEGTGVTANCLHPGVIATSLLRNYIGLPKLFQRILAVVFGSPERGARTTLYLAQAPELEQVSGQFFLNSRAVKPARRGTDPDAALRLWEQSERLCGLAPGDG